MNINDFRELTLSELQTRKREMREEIFKLRLQQKSGQLEKPSMLTTLRRNIARVETIISTKKEDTSHSISQ